jgi:hypothetical protein
MATDVPEKEAICEIASFSYQEERRRKGISAMAENCLHQREDEVLVDGAVLRCNRDDENHSEHRYDAFHLFS